MVRIASLLNSGADIEYMNVSYSFQQIIDLLKISSLSSLLAVHYPSYASYLIWTHYYSAAAPRPRGKSGQKR